MNKTKANILPEETLKIIIAVICLGFLAYLAFAIYGSNLHDREKAEAQSTIERISQEVEGIKANSSYEGRVYALDPSGWFLFSFTENQLKPNFCAGESCLCICKEKYESFMYGLYTDETRQEKECSEKGICIKVENLSSFDKLELAGPNDPTNILIKRNGKFLEVSEI